jgi:hypothetical protein
MENCYVVLANMASQSGKTKRGWLLPALRATLYGWLDAVFWGSEAGALWHSNMESKTCRKEGGRIPAGS